MKQKYEISEFFKKYKVKHNVLHDKISITEYENLYIIKNSHVHIIYLFIVEAKKMMLIIKDHEDKIRIDFSPEKCYSDFRKTYQDIIVLKNSFKIKNLIIDFQDEDIIWSV